MTNTQRMVWGKGRIRNQKISMIGRPQKPGMLFYDWKGSERRWKYFICYCEKCENKIGLTAEELDEVVTNIPGSFVRIMKRLSRMRIVIPK